MQKKYCKFPKKPLSEDAKRLFERVIGPLGNDGKFPRPSGADHRRGARDGREKETARCEEKPS